ncbi:hypothetical protein Afil01_04110 [Actinorhabdospora filicis]|uniref:LppM domain-containing protein n=1 Tax=Actinorhabdospora filicis TaxID=1785913 RepID=A0A9W6W6I7_9ACTN|nr:hypothetical protein [Actinorhabdospora filicis]GLZ75604.1 hypothetical protein Afil01_04110 [Actinorhabdospora filicis]
MITTRGRVLGTALLALFGVLALAGCVKFDMNVTVNRDDTVSGTVVVAFDKALRDRLNLGGDPLGGEPVKGITRQEPYDDGVYAGVRYTFENTPLSEFNDTDDSGGDHIRIVHEGEDYVLTGVIDQTYTPPSGGGPIDPEIIAAFDRADMRVAVTFPGRVLTTNGEVGANGKTVTWKLRLGERNELRATAGPGPNTALAMWVLWIMIALMVIVFLLIVWRLMRVSLR